MHTMTTIQEKFLEGFSRACFEAGLNEDQMVELFEKKAATFFNLTNDQFREGFKKAMEINHLKTDNNTINELVSLVN